MSSIKLSKSFELSKRLTQKEQTERLDSAAKMYEKQFLNQMMKAMRKTVTKSEMNKPNMAEKIYTDQMYDKYVDQWSAQGGIGLAKIIKQQIQEKYMGAIQLPNAKGPMNIHKEKAIKLKTENKNNALPLNEQKQDMSFLIPPAGKNEPVVSPWDSVVKAIHRGENGERSLRLDHGQGVSSMMSFIGTDSALKIGDEIKAGQSLGKINNLDDWLAWRVT